jgi:hypothetical protein
MFVASQLLLGSNDHTTPQSESQLGTRRVGTSPTAQYFSTLPKRGAEPPAHRMTRPSALTR